MINPSIPQASDQMKPRITVIGVGGAGGNAVNNMIRANLEGVDFVTANTDAQAMQQSLANNKIQLGATITRGLGAGARADVGRAAAEEALEDILKSMQGSNMIFITAGMGGGTGTGAAPVIARAARENGILTVGVVTKPFHFEGSLRMRQAEAGIEALQEHVDTLIVIPNQNLFRIANEQTTFAEAFNLADQVLHSGVRGVTDLMIMPGLINLDFNDIRSVMSEMGKAMMGTGEAEGARRAVEAAEAAISNPLLDDVSMKGARGVLINITGGMDMTLFEVDEAANRIRDEVDPDANIIFGSTFDQSMNGKMRVSVVATGIDVETARRTGGDSLRLVSAATSKPTLFNQQSSSSAMGAPHRPSTTTASTQAPAPAPIPQTATAPSNTNTTAPLSATATSAAPRTVAQAASAPQSFAAAPAARTAQPATTGQSLFRTTGFSTQAPTTATPVNYSVPTQSYAGNAALQITPMPVQQPAPTPTLSVVQAQAPVQPETNFAEHYEENNVEGLVPAETSPWANLRPISSSPVAAQAPTFAPAPQPVAAVPTYQPAPAPTMIQEQPELPSFLFDEQDAPKAHTAPAAKKKGPSLFERVTGMASHARRTAETTELTPVAPPAFAGAGSARQQQEASFMGLNLGNAPAAPAPMPTAEPQLLSQQGAKLSSTDEDLLNIPAFLRRQAN